MNTEKQLELHLPPQGRHSVCVTHPDGHRWIRLLVGTRKCAADNCEKPIREGQVICPDCWAEGWEGEEMRL